MTLTVSIFDIDPLTEKETGTSGSLLGCSGRHHVSTVFCEEHFEYVRPSPGGAAVPPLSPPPVSASSARPDLGGFPGGDRRTSVSALARAR